MSSNISENINNSLNNIKRKLVSITPYGTENFLSKSQDFFSSNTLIAKASFLLLIIIVFLLIYYVTSKILKNILSPENSPMLLSGLYNMGSAGNTEIITQNPKDDKTAITVYRSDNEYDGIEFTYSVWIFINDLDLDSDKYYHIFHKGSNTVQNDLNGIYGPNNCPGLYIYTGTKHGETGLSSTELTEKNPTVGLLARINVFNNGDSTEASRYYDDIHVQGIPIKKWVNIVLRSTSQNIVDIYINGTLTKRHELSNVIKQNYNSVYVNLNNEGYPGHLSDLKYYNYAIGTMEINNIISRGPNLNYAKDNRALVQSKPEYLSSKWYFNETELN